MHTTKRSKHAQNRIAYIVYSNPHLVRRLLRKSGYEPPQHIHDLLSVTKELVRKRRRAVVKELLAIHPDKKAILALSTSQESNYCGACSSHSYNAEDKACHTCGHFSYTGGSQAEFLGQLADRSIEELDTLYKNTVKKANSKPEDENLADEVRMIWNELRIRKKEGSAKKADDDDAKDRIKEGFTVRPKEAVVILGLVLVSGVLIGSTIQVKTAS
ncbi:MAG: hypothetical protein JXQ90_18465 [Cyclobacteriaceae bacterium]